MTRIDVENFAKCKLPAKIHSTVKLQIFKKFYDCGSAGDGAPLCGGWSPICYFDFWSEVKDCSNPRNQPPNESARSAHLTARNRSCGARARACICYNLTNLSNGQMLHSHLLRRAQLFELHSARVDRVYMYMIL